MAVVIEDHDDVRAWAATASRRAGYAVVMSATPFGTVECATLHDDAFLTKPVSVAALLACVRQFDRVPGA